MLVLRLMFLPHKCFWSLFLFLSIFMQLEKINLHFCTKMLQIHWGKIPFKFANKTSKKQIILHCPMSCGSSTILINNVSVLTLRNCSASSLFNWTCVSILSLLMSNSSNSSIYQFWPILMKLDNCFTFKPRNVKSSSFSWLIDSFNLSITINCNSSFLSLQEKCRVNKLTFRSPAFFSNFFKTQVPTITNFLVNCHLLKSRWYISGVYLPFICDNDC